ncbi:MAG: hypothetical protein ACI8QZ_003082 [Chlamydiales bacterium]|jgi:hypothetical protein
MVSVRIVVTEAEEVLSDVVFATESSKRLTARRVARLLARTMPGFGRRKGRLSIFDGMEILPAVEKSGAAWLAWRLRAEGDAPSGFEPPLSGGTGKANSRDNPLSDRSRGVWQRAEISELSDQPTKARRRKR